MEKLCVIYNYTQNYRKAIFKLIDSRFQSVWYFGRNQTDVEGFDIGILKDAHLVDNKYFKFHFYYQKDIINLAFKKDIGAFLVLGDPFCVSTWMLCMKVKLATHKKIYFWTHGWYGKETSLRKIFKKVFFNLADGIFLYGNYARDMMISEGFDKNRLFVIHNSLDYDNQIKIRKELTNTNLFQDHFKNDNKNLIFIGRLTTVKKLDLILDALASLNKKGEYYNLTFIGDGVEIENLKKKVVQENLLQQVWFYGKCYDDKVVAEFLYNADLCVAPGNVGLTAMHSMVFGTPVITHNDFKYQMPEFESIKENVTGSFFERDNLQSMVSCIQKWFSCNSTKREAIRLNCYEEIDKYWNPYFQIKVLEDHLNYEHF